MKSGTVAIALFSLICAISFPARAAENPNKNPILVELFTSEGCSSCPPADAQLRQLDRTQPFAGAELIVLSEHVDYWNHLGWKDPYSSPEFSARQAAYASHFALAGSYTPQLVIDGSTECVGGDASAVSHAIEKTRTAAKVAVKISGATVDPSGILRAHVDVDALPTSAKGKAAVYVAAALDHAASQVARGENEGRRLEHVAVVLELKAIGEAARGKSFSQDIQLKLKAGSDLSQLRLIAFVQEAGPARVLGAAVQRVGN